MKNIKLRIVYLILGAALLLFALFMLAVNVVIPRSLCKRGGKGAHQRGAVPEPHHPLYRRRADL